MAYHQDPPFRHLQADGDCLVENRNSCGGSCLNAQTSLEKLGGILQNNSFPVRTPYVINKKCPYLNTSYRRGLTQGRNVVNQMWEPLGGKPMVENVEKPLTANSVLKFLRNLGQHIFQPYLLKIVNQFNVLLTYDSHALSSPVSTWQLSMETDPMATECLVAGGNSRVRWCCACAKLRVPENACYRMLRTDIF